MPENFSEQQDCVTYKKMADTQEVVLAFLKFLMEQQSSPSVDEESRESLEGICANMYSFFPQVF